jgi:large subunit ribosomal protein L25
MEIPAIKADSRNAAGSRAAARLRRSGKLPGVVYGHKQETVAVALDRHDMELHLEHGAHLLQVELGGKAQPCLIKDVQYDHLGSTPVHVDLARVDLNERVKVRVPIELRGHPKGVAEGGVLRQELSDLEVECLVARIPEKVRIDVSHLALHEVLYVKDLKLETGLKATRDPETVVATVRLPQVHVEAPVVGAPAEGAAEPEVIAKGKVEEEPVEGAEKEKKAAEKKPAEKEKK